MATTDVSQYDGLLAQKKKLRRRAEIRKTVPLFLMMLPGLVYLFCNNYLPMFGILIASLLVNRLEKGETPKGFRPFLLPGVFYVKSIENGNCSVHF